MARRSPIALLVMARTTALSTTLPAAIDGDSTAVHQARVASRRLRELLPTLEPRVSAATPAATAVRRVTRALGPVRELDVTSTLFAALVQGEATHPLARLGVERTLVRSRVSAARAMRRSLAAGRRLRLAASLDALAQEVATVPLRAVAPQVQRRVARRAGRVGDALERLGVLYDPERLHDVRIAIKRLRYAVEISVALRLSRAAAPLRQLRAAQALLGRAHDAHVLAETLRGVEARLVTRSRPAAVELRQLADRLDGECRQWHAAFLGRTAGVFDLVTSLDRTAPSTARRTAA